MKKTFISVILLCLATLQLAAQELSPYILAGNSNASMEETSSKIIQSLKDHSFTILGVTHPENNASLKVIAFTREDLKNIVIKINDRGALAGVLKVGLVSKNGKVSVSFINPEYLFNAYLRTNYKQYASPLSKVTNDLKAALSLNNDDFRPFGGKIKADKLWKYHYKIMMPYFSDPVVLNRFNSFEEGLRIIRNNLKNKKGQTSKVFELIYQEEQVAVFGVALQNKEDGEAHFLPIIGEDHIAAMPYEIILQGKEVTMLHGKYRLALHWPELTMGTFMKIMSTPGDIEDALEQVSTQ